jgi:hypothetical protein
VKQKITLFWLKKKNIARFCFTFLVLLPNTSFSHHFASQFFAWNQKTHLFLAAVLNKLPAVQNCMVLNNYTSHA